jgi:hypothetical protein
VLRVDPNNLRSSETLLAVRQDREVQRKHRGWARAR